MDCPEGWETHPGSWHCFKLKNKVQHAEAIGSCKRENSYLVTIYDEQGNLYIQNLMQTGRLEAADSAWLGAMKGSNNDYSWDDGSQMTFRNFGNPTDTKHPDGQCLYIDTHTGLWYPDECDW